MSAPSGAADRGSASVWVLTAAGIVFAVAAVVVLYGSAVTARHKAGTAADLAALAAAERLWTGDADAPCSAAAHVARRNGAKLIACHAGGGVADVRTRVRLHGLLERVGAAGARSRAVPGAVGGPFALAPTVTRDVGPGQMGPEGLTPRARRIRDLVRSKFHENDIGGYCPGGCKGGHIPGSDHYTGRAIDIMIVPWHDKARVAKGWHLASWLVANAKPLGVKYVIYRARIWTPDEGWHHYEHPSGNTSNPTLQHMDHVHVSVY